MHELGIIQDIFPLIEKIAKDNHLRSVSKVILGVGRLRQVQGDFLRFAFEVMAKATIAEGAELVVNFIPIKVFCRSCKKEFEVKDNVYVCPKCNNVSLDILTGKDVILESVEGCDSVIPRPDRGI